MQSVLSFYSNRRKEIRTCDFPRRSAEGRGAEGDPPSGAKSSVRETGRWGDAKRGIGDIKKTRSSQFSLEQPGSYLRSGSDTQKQIIPIFTFNNIN